MRKGRRIYTCNDGFFSEETPEAFYWAGFFAADGSVNNRNRVRLGLAIKDVGHMKKFKAAVGHDGKIYYARDGLSAGMQITSKTMCDDLIKFNIIPRKSLVYEFPDWLGDHPLVNHFIRGYNDGDGSFYSSPPKNGRTVWQLSFSLRGTKQCLTAIKKILERECSIFGPDKKPRLSSGIYALECGGNRIVGKIRDFLYKDSTEETRLDRKYEFCYQDQFANLPESFLYRPVVGINIKTGERRSYKCIGDVVEAGIANHHTGVISCCRGKYKYHKGWMWAYAENADKLSIEGVKINPNSESYTVWTEEEENFIKENYKTLSSHEMAAKLDRTSKAINKKLVRLGLFRKKQKTRSRTCPKETNKT